MDTKTFAQGLSFAVGAVLLNAVGIVMVKRIIEGDGFFWLITLRLLGGIAGTLIFLGVTKRIELLRSFKKSNSQENGGC